MKTVPALSNRPQDNKLYAIFSGFANVLESNLYGNKRPVKKLKCIGHVQKRTGSRIKIFKLKEGEKNKLTQKILVVGIDWMTLPYYLFRNTMVLLLVREYK